MSRLFDHRHDGDFYRVHVDMPARYVRIVQRPPDDAPPGYLHLYEHMVMRSAAPFFAEIGRLGGVSNAVTTSDDVSFYALLPGHCSLQFTADVLAVPFTASDLEQERRVVLEERLLCPATEHDADEVLGSPADIERFDIDTLADFRRRLSGPLTVTYTALAESAQALPVVDRIAPRIEVSEGGRRLVVHDDPGSLDARLFAFFLHMVAVVAPHDLGLHLSTTWPLVVDCPDPQVWRYVREHVDHLAFRYRFLVSGLKRFDSEFFTYISLVDVPVDLLRSFKESSWSHHLPAD